MNKHVASVHVVKKPFKCDICDYRCSLKGNMKSHVSTVHEGKKAFKCDICMHSCLQKRDMSRHIASVHEKQKPCNCDICDYSCYRKSQMNRHFASVHEEKTSIFNFHGKMSDVMKSNNDSTVQKQGQSNAMLPTGVRSQKILLTYSLQKYIKIIVFLSIEVMILLRIPLRRSKGFIFFILWLVQGTHNFSQFWGARASDVPLTCARASDFARATLFVSTMWLLHTLGTEMFAQGGLFMK